MKSTYTKPNLEIINITAEAGFALSQPDGGEIGPSSADYSVSAWLQNDDNEVQ